MRIQLSLSRNEDGAVAVMVAIFAMVLLAIAAFTTDFGMAYAQRRALSTGADSAALGVVRAMHTSEVKNPTGSCDTLKAEYNVVEGNGSTKASNIALAQVNANAPFGATLASSDVNTKLECLATGPLQVTVTAKRAIDPILGGVLGSGPMNVNRSAVAALGVANGVRGLSPIAVCIDQAKAIMANSGVVQLVPASKVWKDEECKTLDKNDKEDKSGSGNRGWIEFPGQGNGEKALGKMIASGYSGAVTLNPTTPPSTLIGGTPGVKGGAEVNAGMKTLIDSGRPITLPVYSTVKGNGSGADYTVIGFLTVKLCGYDGYYRASTATFTSCYDSTLKMEKDDMQVLGVEYMLAAQLGTLCEIGKPCAFNAYVFKLLE